MTVLLVEADRLGNIPKELEGFVYNKIDVRLKPRIIPKARKKGNCMSIVLVGGHDRMHDEYKEICFKRGHSVKVFTQMPARFDKLIGNPDRLILFTCPVSHRMIHTAVKEAKRKNIPILRCHNGSATSLDGLLQQLESTPSSR